MFTFRFDMRAPNTGAPSTQLYKTALEMSEFAEDRGLLATILCEHHGSADGYLPAPLILASALAARTSKMPINVAIFMLPLYDPIRLAEHMCVLDILSKGRVSYVGGIGYVPSEYEASGVDFHRRGKIADEKLELLLRAKTGEPFDHEGRKIHITPPPVTPGGPTIMWGGGSLAAVKRAGRLGLGFMGQSGGPGLLEAYEEACKAHGHAVGTCMLPTLDTPGTIFVAEDVDKAWEEISPYLMHDVLGYAQWNEGREVSSVSFASTAEELRADNRTHRILSVEEAIEWVKAGNHLPLHPIIGGMPPEIAWRYLHTVTDEVMPALQ